MKRSMKPKGKTPTRFNPPADPIVRMTIRIPQSLQDYVLDLCKIREPELCGHVTTGRIFTESMIAQHPEYREMVKRPQAAGARG